MFFKQHKDFARPKFVYTAPNILHNLTIFTQPPTNLHKPGLQVCVFFQVWSWTFQYHTLSKYHGPSEGCFKRHSNGPSICHFNGPSNSPSKGTAHTKSHRTSHPTAHPGPNKRPFQMPFRQHLQWPLQCMIFPSLF